MDGTGGTVSARVCDRDDGDGDDGVEDGGEDLDTSELERTHEWRVTSVSTGSAGQVWVVRWNNQSEEEERDNIEQANTPEHLLGSLGDSLSWVVRFGSGKTNQLSSSESESSSDEDGAETLEAVAERARVVPVVSSNIASLVGRYATTVDDNSQDDETDDSNNLDRTENEFDFTVTLGSEHVDNDNHSQEDSDPYTNVN